jgi:hypothetical protein
MKSEVLLRKVGSMIPAKVKMDPIDLYLIV